MNTNFDVEFSGNNVTGITTKGQDFVAIFAEGRDPRETLSVSQLRGIYRLAWETGLRISFADSATLNAIAS